MIHPRDYKFSTKILMGIFIPLLLLSITFGSYMVIELRDNALLGIDEKGKSISKLLAAMSVIPVVTHDYLVLEEHVKEVLGDKEIIYAVIFDKNKKNLTKTKAKSDKINLEKQKVYTSPIVHNNGVVGEVEIGISTARFKKELSQNVSFFLSITLFAVVSCFFLAYLISALATQPLRKIVDIMKRVEDGDFSLRQEVKARDEIGSLARGFNAMLDQIERRNIEISLANKHLEQEISERKKMETQLRQAHKMEAIGTLAGGIAHDFNNILTSIIGFAELAQRNISKEDSAHSDLSTVLSAANRAKDLVRQLLTFSRQTEQEKIPLQIQYLLKEILKLLRASIPACIEIHQSVDLKCSVVLADPTQIHQVVMNLCTNATHAMEKKGGVLTIGLHEVNLDKEDVAVYENVAVGQYVRLSVSDTGGGIDPAIEERIFDPFFTTKEVGKGTGMGLPMVHGIMKSHKGMITVDNELGKGATFHVFFPVTKEEIIEDIKAEALPGGNERILFVDDEEEIIIMGKRILEHLGYKVSACSNSIDALNTFRATSDHFDLVITDLMMPNMTGKDLANKILHIKPDIPIILCSGYSELIEEEDVKRIGFREYMMKPLVISEMAEIVRRVLDGGKS